MKLVLEIAHPEADHAIHRVVEEFPVTIGRGYHNDIIFSDPHVGESHLRIDFDGTQWTLTDLGSVNPTTVNAKPLRAASAALSSGDMLRLGHTTLRVFSAAHEVPAPVKMQKTSPAFLWLTRPLNVWASFALATAAVAGWAYVGIWTEDKGLTLASASSGAMAGIVVWAALWSVAGRLVRRKSYFMAHVAVASLAVIIGVIIWLVSGYFAFLTSEGWPSMVTNYALNAALLAMVLYSSLSLSTLMKKRKRMQAALFFSGGIVLGILAVGLVSNEKFSTDALYPYRLEPYLANLAPEDTPDQFMSDSAKVFDSDEFKAKKKD